MAFELVERDLQGREAARVRLDLPLVGRYNVHNLLGVLAAARALGVTLAEALRASGALPAVSVYPGRRAAIRCTIAIRGSLTRRAIGQAAMTGGAMKLSRADLAFAVAEGRTDGKGKLILSAKGQVLGAAIVGPAAGDLIQPWVLAMTSKLKLTAMTSIIAPYPTRGEINKRLAGQYFTPLLFSARTRLLVSLLKRLA